MGATALKSIGFTGTREGMTKAQKAIVYLILSNLRYAGHETFHHGDCVGADAEAHDIARDLGFKIIGHPPTNKRYRAFKACDELRPEEPTLARNERIVQESEIMIATPKGDHEEVRSGTWFTVRRARVYDRALTIVWPDGMQTEREVGGA